MQHAEISADDLTLGASPVTPALAGPQKAAIIVQMILSEGGSLPLKQLADPLQKKLAVDFAGIGRVDRETLAQVVQDFEAELDGMGLSFASSLSDALSTLEGHISPDLALEMRSQMRVTSPPATAWPRITALPAEQLVAILPAEDPKIAAVVLSKLPDDTASEVLALLDEDTAAHLSLAMQETGDLSPAFVQRVGALLNQALPPERPAAFAVSPALRMANILNASAATRRDQVLASLKEKDPVFAAEVRAAIFTFADIATRIGAEDVPKITRDIAQLDLVMALAHATTIEPLATEFLLGSLSQRMANALRDEMEELGQVGPQRGETAMQKVTNAIRSLADDGEITVLSPDVQEQPER